jgi:hypothetical protein
MELQRMVVMLTRPFAFVQRIRSFAIIFPCYILSSMSHSMRTAFISGRSVSTYQRQCLTRNAEMMQSADGIQDFARRSPMDAAGAIDRAERERIERQNLLPSWRQSGAENHNVCSLSGSTESFLVTVYRAENFYSFSATAKPLAPSGVEWIACRS